MYTLQQKREEGEGEKITLSENNVAESVACHTKSAADVLHYHKRLPESGVGSINP